MTVSLGEGQPAVSVVMIFLNAEKFLQEAIDSVLVQTFDQWELMLVDDGSSDRSSRIAQSYAAEYPARIKYLEHDQHANRGMSASRNLGIRHSRGRYIAFLDSDDAWLPHKLERQIAILEAHPRADMVYGASRYWHAWTGNPEDMDRDFVPDPGVSAETLYHPPSLLTRLYPFGEATTPPPSDFLVRREAIDAVGGFEEEFRGIHQLFDDQAFLVKMYLKGSIYVSSEEWDKYRIHPDSCDSAAAKGGHYGSIRAFFLRWFQSYLRKEAISDPAIWSLLEAAVRDARTELRTDCGGVASLLYKDGDPAWVRVAIEKAGSGGMDIQLNRPLYSLFANHNYTLQFQARADQPRSFFVGVAAAHVPWTGLGLYRKLEMTAEWRNFELEFTPSADDEYARIHFDLGESGVSVEFTDVTLRLTSGGELVEPSLGT